MTLSYMLEFIATWKWGSQGFHVDSCFLDLSMLLHVTKSGAFSPSAENLMREEEMGGVCEDEGGVGHFYALMQAS